MPRLNEMEQKYIEKLIEFANLHPDYGSASDVWHAINQADPDNQRHIHTRWLLERTLSKDKDRRILWEDIAAGANSKAHDILKRFLTIRPMLPHDKRNLYRYGNLADVTAVIRPLEHVKTPGELKAEERKRVDNATVILYEQDGYKILVPMSEEASCYWGRGTEWCTAATKSSNAFQSYHKRGPLVIVIAPDGKKVQFHDNSPPMDENDAALRDVTDPILVQLCAYYGYLSPIHETFRDKETCLEAIKHNGQALQDVPEELRDREMYLEAVKHNGQALQDVPEELRDREMYLEAVKHNGQALQDVPEELRDREMYLTAVKKHGDALRYVPEHLWDKEICLEAVRQNGIALCYVPEHLRDKDICLEAVRQDGIALCYVPEHLRDKEMCLAAVKNHGGALRFVPKHLWDKEICLVAVKKYGGALYSVPKHLWDKEICLEAVRQNGDALRFVPKYLRDKEICLVAVKKYGGALHSVPEKIKHEITECLREYKSKIFSKENTNWDITSVLDDMTQYLQKTCSFSTVSPKM